MRKLARVTATFVSGCVVYAVVAACTAGDRTYQGAPGRGAVPNAMADEWWRAGSRLKLRFLEAEDGARQSYGWWDSTIGQACGFAFHADGSTRCLPSDVQVGEYWADAACSTPLASQSLALNPAPPKFAVRFDLDAGGFRVLAVTGRFIFTPFHGARGACSSASGDLWKSFLFWNVGDEQPASSFVAVAMKLSP